MTETATKVWWGDKELDVDNPSWRTGSDAKRQRIEVLIEWLLTPPSERVPRTKAELAAMLDVSEATLRNYNSDPYLQRSIAQRTREVARIERLPAILDSLYKQATALEKPSTAAAKVLLDWLEKTEKAREAQLDFSDMTSAELAELAMELLSHAQRG